MTLPLRSFLIICICCLLMSCQKNLSSAAQRTTYGDLQISEDTYELMVYNGAPSRTEYLTMAATITVENNAKYFVILSDKREKHNTVQLSYAEPINLTTNILTVPVFDSDNYTYMSFGAIRIYNEMPPDDEFYDAQLLVDNFGMIDRDRIKPNKGANILINSLKLYDLIKGAFR